MPIRCVLMNCSNYTSVSEGIGIHKIPFWNDERPEAKKRRKKWTDFIKRTRAKWTPTQYSALCSKHFVSSDFERPFHDLPGMTASFRPRLRRDEIGIVVYPSIYPPKPNSDASGQEDRPASSSSAERRDRRMVRRRETYIVV